MYTRNRIRAALAPMALLLILLPACDTTPPKGTAVGPMVQNVTSDSFTIVWYDHNPKDVQCSATAETGEIFDIRAVKGDDFGRRVATFEHLEPNTEYTYRLGNRKTKTEYRTRTAPRPTTGDATDAGTPEFRILAFGDSGSGSEDQYKLADVMFQYLPDVMVHTGDLIYPDGERDDYPDKFYAPYAKLLARAPFYPCLGNHDVRTARGKPMFSEFELPENGPPSETPERHYWFDYGSVRFVAIDTNVYREKLEKIIVPWLDEVLAVPGPRWKICFFHHPVYTNANYGPTHKLWNTIVPVMEKRGVQLVLSGHDHLYEHSYPIRDRKVVKPGNGIVYITTGAGGKSLYKQKPTPIPEIKTQYDSDYSFTVIDVTFDALKLMQVNSKNTVIDEFEIPHQKAAAESTETTKKEKEKTAA